jgi:GxxExxY protein
MPIQVQSQINIFSQEEYHALNRRLLRVAFDVQNDFGRFLDETLAKREIAARCAEIGIVPVEREVRIRVSHEGFVKDYSMDLLLAGGVMIEVKTTDGTAPAHRAQALNYLLLTGMHHGTLVNLRTNQVEHEYVSTQLTPERRRHFSVVDTDWREVNPQSRNLKQCLLDLLHDWGAFLEITLYREAVAFHLGGAGVVQRPIEVFSGLRCLGTQTLAALTPDTIFALSAVTARPDQYGAHLTRFLGHTRLRNLQWVNLNHHQIEFRTLSNSSLP